MLCKNNKGIPLYPHNSTKWAPLSAASLNITPLFVTIPTSYPYILPNPVTKVYPYFSLNSLNSEPSKILLRILLASNGYLRSVGIMWSRSKGLSRGS